VRVALGHGEKRRGAGWGHRGSAVEDGEASATLNQAREAVRWPSDDGNAAAVKELGGGGARA
jgi:hypothetical protein